MTLNVILNVQTAPFVHQQCKILQNNQQMPKSANTPGSKSSKYCDLKSLTVLFIADLFANHFIH